MSCAAAVVRAWREALNARDLALMLTLVNDRLEVLTPRGTKRGLRSVRESMAQSSAVSPRYFVGTSPAFALRGSGGPALDLPSRLRRASPHL